MKTRHYTLLILVVLVLGAVAAEEALEVISISSATATSYLAVRVPMSEDSALQGVRWYHNDEAVFFPSFSLAQLQEDGGPALAGSMQMAENLAGPESEWAELQFLEAVSSEVGDLFLVMQFPEGAENSSPGEGPGIGYVQSEDSAEAWVCVDGQNWTRLHESLSVQMEPVYAAGKALSGGVVFAEPEIPVFETHLSTPSPNPFNPRVSLKFTLAKQGKVELMVYNLRGQCVRTLVSAKLLPGQHERTWEGANDRGQSVSSGVYFAVLKTTTHRKTQRMVLVR